MPRIPYVSRDDLDADGKRVWDEFAAPREGRVENGPRLMLNSPKAAERVFAMNTYLRFEALLPPKALALATVVTGAVNHSEYILAWHVPGAEHKGVSKAAIEAALGGGSLEGLPEEEALVIRYCREVLAASVSAETFAAAEEAFGARTLLDLTFVIGQYTLMHLVGSAFELTRDEDWRPLLV